MKIVPVALREQVPIHGAFLELRELPGGGCEAFASAPCRLGLSTAHALHDNIWQAEAAAKEWAAERGVTKLYLIRRLPRQL